MAIQTEWCPENFGFMPDNAFLGNNGGLDALNRFGFYPSLQQQQPFQFNHNLENMASMMPPEPVLVNSPINLAADFEKQKLDIDRFICIQNERLRFALQEQRKEHLGYILKNYEAKMQVLLKQKDGEIMEAMKKAMELETTLKRLETDNQTWQRVAKEKEAMVVSLSNTFQRVRESACLSAVNGAEDAASCCVNDRTGTAGCGGSGGGECHDDDQVLFFLDQGNGSSSKEQGTRKMVCKSCNVRSSCVVFLPCRHLCSCKPCEAFLDSCPVCRMTKKACIEAVL